MATPIPENFARFSIEEILQATRGTPRGAALEIRGITSDTRAVVPGAGFVALVGQNHDGHSFAGQAFERGAVLAIVQRGRAPRTGSVVEVDDTLVAWGDLARRHLDRWRGRDRRVVAITGSAGKTTTKEMTAALLRAVASTHATRGNLNNRIGVPATVFALRDERFVVLEMGMSLRGELDAITSVARPDVSVITNVGVAHAEGVGGREGVKHEKGAVFRALDTKGVAVVNADDPFVLRAAEEAKVANALRFGRAESADYRLVDREGGLVSIVRPSGELTFAVGVPGEAAAIDVAAALAAQEIASGVVLPAEAITAALATMNLEGRARVTRLADDVILLDDSYNANPASMRAALETLRELGTKRRLVAVLGEMKELGPLADEEHDTLGDVLADAKVALVIGCGGLVDRTLARANARGIATASAASTEEAAALAVARIEPGDAVLVKGSRGVRAEKVVSAIVARLPEVLPLSSKSAVSV